jgi:hypothetical protein
MFHPSLVTGTNSGRKQQTAVKQTVERPKSHVLYNNHRHQANLFASTSLDHQITYDDHRWLKSSTKEFDDIPELELTCQEEMLTDVQLKNYPSQVNRFMSLN